MNLNPDKPRPSMRDIAKILGVTHATVSLALKNHPRISDAMKKRIHALCEELGYQRDPMLTALASYRLAKAETPVRSGLAWINGWRNPNDLRSHKEFDFYWQGAHASARKSGYRVEEFRLGGSMTPDRLHQILDTRGIRGLLLPPHEISPDWGDFPWSEYFIVRFGRSLRYPHTHLVAADQLSNAVLAVKSIRDRGYRRIGFVSDDRDDRSHGMLFSAGFAQAQGDLPPEDRIPMLDIHGLNPDEYAEALCAWITKHKVEAIFTNRRELMAMLARAGLKVPDDVAVAVTSVLDAHADAGINQHPEEIGHVGFLMLNSLINDGSRGIPDIFRQILVAGSWVDGSTLPDRR